LVGKSRRTNHGREAQTADSLNFDGALAPRHLNRSTAAFESQHGFQSRKLIELSENYVSFMQAQKRTVRASSRRKFGLCHSEDGELEWWLTKFGA
jgi:hypothetical protein